MSPACAKSTTKRIPAPNAVQCAWRLLMTFPEWVTFIFDHPVTDPAWYWNSSGDWDAPDLTELQTVDYLTQLFEGAGTLLLPYTDAQVNQGLWYLLVRCDDMHSLRDLAVPLPDRLRGIQAMEVLFNDCFAVRCSPHLSHMDEPGRNPLNAVCYMWWDVLPIHGLNRHQPERADSAELDQACLGVMQRTLKSDSIACQESALHGLGHWTIYYSEPAKYITNFLRRKPKIRPELKEYAMRARHDCIA